MNNLSSAQGQQYQGVQYLANQGGLSQPQLLVLDRHGRPIRDAQVIQIPPSGGNQGVVVQNPGANYVYPGTPQTVVVGQTLSQPVQGQIVQHQGHMVQQQGQMVQPQGQVSQPQGSSGQPAVPESATPPPMYTPSQPGIHTCIHYTSNGKFSIIMPGYVKSRLLQTVYVLIQSLAEVNLTPAFYRIC